MCCKNRGIADRSFRHGCKLLQTFHSPDMIPCGGPGLKHQLTKLHNFRVAAFVILIRLRPASVDSPSISTSNRYAGLTARRFLLQTDMLG